ncbi:S-adenosyl-L-methionine-dependent tRNA 4-demethylwyosine synthase TYW1-like [Melopsittacus undulatus]|uniref:S-adenosyl-L-methionine-dependent tRNA 4-demethylwyosine synthase TYW1-like n=1 Tax=Melopsittacus undulatus TaxID=13146 RepID=UPI00146D9D1D|nr:S-adenosyl-L-methionine-dependent tRNA 4-demethylwyosine synthase TYW1-like [Melopsittacus undulatus]
MRKGEKHVLLPKNLEPVTQLSVSVDASTKESLKRIDCPLFKGFWQRFLDSLKALSEKQEPTVYRLTLVKACNVDALKVYADLISLGKPGFIKVKSQEQYLGKLRLEPSQRIHHTASLTAAQPCKPEVSS